MERLKKILKDVPENWKNILYSEKEYKLENIDISSKKLLDRILENLEDVNEEIFCPELDKWFEFARITPLELIRIIIIGQDPYHTKKDNKCYAHGLAFSCKKKVPPSLRNIYKCLENNKLISNQKDIKSGDLTSWATQGVLLLNASLSTEVGSPNKHQYLWNSYTNFIIQRLCEISYDNNYQLMFLLWGKNAAYISDLIDSDFHIVKKWAHPSPTAQIHLNEEEKFVNCDHFIEANIFLEDWGLKSIKWNSIIENETKFFNGHKKKIIVFTDGSCKPNKKNNKSRGGFASLFAQGPFKDTVIFGNLCLKKSFASNIRAEGQAIISTLEFIKKDLTKWTECIIVTDCEFWIKMINKHMPRWSKEKFKQKSNSDITIKLWKLWKNLMSENKELSLYHVNSHNKSGWKYSNKGTFEHYCYKNNDYVDKVCGYARQALSPGKIKITEVEYISDSE